MLDAAALAANVIVFDVDLRGLRKAGQLLVGRLRGDDAGRVRPLLADDRDGTADSVERLMGTKAEARFAFISDKAEFADDDLLDV